MSPLFLAIGKFFCLLTLSLTHPVRATTFGNFCNESVPCAAGAWLLCSEFSSCACTDPSIMTFDLVKSKCVAKVDQKCEVQIPDVTESGVGIPATIETPDCGSNARCGANSICSCNPGFYDTADGTCLPRKNFTATCASDRECQFEEAFLKCVDGSCGCEPAKSVYMAFREPIVTEMEGSEVMRRPEPPRRVKRESITRGRYDYSTSSSWTISELSGQCVGLAGAECNPDSYCVGNSSCYEGICYCDWGFDKTRDGRCGSAFGQTCSSQLPCAEGFVCRSGKCTCPHPSHQTHDSRLRKCLGQLYAFCEIDADCAENSICVLSTVSGKKQCACADGPSDIYLTENGKCRTFLKVGDACTLQGYYYPTTKSLICSPGLECLDGFCTCSDTMTVYRKELRKCVGLVGSRCTVLGYNSQCNIIAAQEACVERASCVQPSYSYTFVGQCRCQPGYSYTSKGFCTKE